MSVDQIFDSCVRSAGDLAGVFEYESGVGYFYLYDMTADKDRKIVGAIRVLTSTPDFDPENVGIRWDVHECNVGLFIRGQLWAAFDGRTRARFGGDYTVDVDAEIPTEIMNAFHQK
jgi:hypothetical protein